MSEFTKQEIILCKQVVEKHRREIKYGDWYYYKKGKKILCYALKGIYLSEDEIKNGNIIPLWTISDCLEFLREKYDHVDLKTRRDIHNCFVGQSGEHNGHGWTLIDWQEEGNGKTPLEACLKAVLAVLEEEK